MRLSMPLDGAFSESSMLTSMGSAWVLALRSDQMAESVLLISATESTLMVPMG